MCSLCYFVPLHARIISMIYCVGFNKCWWRQFTGFPSWIRSTACALWGQRFHEYLQGSFPGFKVGAPHCVIGTYSGILRPRPIFWRRSELCPEDLHTRTVISTLRINPSSSIMVVDSVKFCSSSASVRMIVGLMVAIFNPFLQLSFQLIPCDLFVFWETVISR